MHPEVQRITDFNQLDEIDMQVLLTMARAQIDLEAKKAKKPGSEERAENVRKIEEAMTSPQVLGSRAQMADYSEYVEECLKNAEPIEDPWQDLTNRQKAFLYKVLQTGSVLLACSGVCHPAAHYKWKQVSEKYAEAFTHVLELLKEKMIAFAYNLAIVGERVPLIENGYPHIHNGKQVYNTVRSDKVLIALVRPLITSWFTPNKLQPA